MRRRPGTPYNSRRGHRAGDDVGRREQRPRRRRTGPGSHRGRWLLVVVTALFLLVVTPVVLERSPLADDYHTCLRPVEDGSYGPFLADSWREPGAVRPARFLEIAAIAGLCQRIPFGFVILIPWR